MTSIFFKFLKRHDEQFVSFVRQKDKVIPGLN